MPLSRIGESELDSTERPALSSFASCFAFLVFAEAKRRRKQQCRKRKRKDKRKKGEEKPLFFRKKLFSLRQRPRGQRPRVLLPRRVTRVRQGSPGAPPRRRVSRGEPREHGGAGAGVVGHRGEHQQVRDRSVDSVEQRRAGGRGREGGERGAEEARRGVAARVLPLARGRGRGGSVGGGGRGGGGGGSGGAAGARRGGGRSSSLAAVPGRQRQQRRLEAAAAALSVFEAARALVLGSRCSASPLAALAARRRPRERRPRRREPLLRRREREQPQQGQGVQRGAPSGLPAREPEGEVGGLVEGPGGVVEKRGRERGRKKFSRSRERERVRQVVIVARWPSSSRRSSFLLGFPAPNIL